MSELAWKESFKFLEKLKNNNNREWFDANKNDFKKHQDFAKKFFQDIQQEMSSFDDISDMKMFRIYRDVRFSNDKTPYKTHFSASFTRNKPELRGGYYIQLEPGNSFLATGFWAPNAEDLLRVRNEIDSDGARFQKIIETKSVKKSWGDLKGEALKTAPKGFDKAHPYVEFLRYKQFIYTKQFSDEMVFSPEFKSEIISSFKAIRPFFDYMSEVLTTNINGESII